ncbi:MAG: alpha/beta hydrolase [Gammaproteobacteria bacterium]|nr:alpha/beta hydrolase [Gammaproteobacteria bacterium]
MDHLIIVAAAIIVCIGLPFLIIFAVEKIKKIKIRNKHVQRLVLSILLFLITVYVYLSAYNKALPEAKEYLNSSSTVEVIEHDRDYLFDGPGENTLIVFYPGAKVEMIAYAPLMFKLAEAGYDTHIVRMPFNMAFFGINRMNKVVKVHNNYKNYIIMGHSLGGAMAACYATKHTDMVSGLVLLGSYSTEKIAESIPTLSIYGSNDLCLNKKLYDKNYSNFPSVFEEFIIDGGNHTQYAYYHLQKGDGIAVISYDEQTTITKNKIVEFFNKNLKVSA